MMALRGGARSFFGKIMLIHEVTFVSFNEENKKI